MQNNSYDCGVLMIKVRALLQLTAKILLIIIIINQVLEKHIYSPYSSPAIDTVSLI